MKLLVNLNEAPSCYAGYMGVYVILMKSDRDGTLAWPFIKDYTFILVDQQDDLSRRENIEVTMGPQGEEMFQRPRQRENESAGEPQFVRHSTLRTRQYIRDHAVYIKIVIYPWNKNKDCDKLYCMHRLLVDSWYVPDIHSLKVLVQERSSSLDLGAVV